ncbi:MAG: replicative DNA helicase [Polaromonas sp.]|nr:replicative DNA helicase [Polaromonas sp.]
MPVDGFLVDTFTSIEAESALIGAMLLDNAVFDQISDKLRPDHFSAGGLRDIFTEVTQQILAGMECDIVTVSAAMGDKTSLSQLNLLAQYVPSAANIGRYSEIVIGRAKSRALMALSREINELAQDHRRGIEERVQEAQAQLARLVDDAPRDEFVSAYEGMTQHTQTLEDRAEGNIKVWPTGLADLDEYLEGGLRPGELVIVGARPSMGKTALAMTLGLNMAASHSIAMLSMEMPHNEVRDRMTAMLGNVSLSSVKRPNFGDGLEWNRVLEGVEKAKQLMFYVSDQGGLNINDVRSKARYVKRLHGMNVLIVDYIGLMSGMDARQPRAYQLEEISRGLKTLAKELEIAVVCLAQVNRKVEERADATPALSDLRDSGAIEQDADVVLFVHRPIQAKPDMNDDWQHYAKVSIAKNRQGRCGVISLSYIGEQTRFSDWSGPTPSRSAFSSGSRAGI